MFDFVSVNFDVDISQLLGLGESWEYYDGFSKTQILLVVSAARRETKMSEPYFWLQVKQYTYPKLEGVEREFERREWDLERVRLAASLPIEVNLNKIQR